MNTPLLYFVREVNFARPLLYAPAWGQVFPNGMKNARLLLGSPERVDFYGRRNTLERIVYSAVLFRDGRMYYESKPFEHVFRQRVTILNEDVYSEQGPLWCVVPLADIFLVDGLKGNGLQFCD